MIYKNTGNIQPELGDTVFTANRYATVMEMHHASSKLIVIFDDDDLKRKVTVPFNTVDFARRKKGFRYR